MKDPKRAACKSCNGRGHDKNSYPVVKFVPTQCCKECRQELCTCEGVCPCCLVSERVTLRKHKTVKQGSGCIVCGGVGYV